MQAELGALELRTEGADISLSALDRCALQIGRDAYDAPCSASRPLLPNDAGQDLTYSGPVELPEGKVRRLRSRGPRREQLVISVDARVDRDWAAMVPIAPGRWRIPPEVLGSLLLSEASKAVPILGALRGRTTIGGVDSEIVWGTAAATPIPAIDSRPPRSASIQLAPSPEIAASWMCAALQSDGSDVTIPGGIAGELDRLRSLQKTCAEPVEARIASVCSVEARSLEAWTGDSSDAVLRRGAALSAMYTTCPTAQAKTTAEATEAAILRVLAREGPEPSLRTLSGLDWLPTSTRTRIFAQLAEATEARVTEFLAREEFAAAVALVDRLEGASGNADTVAALWERVAAASLDRDARTGRLQELRDDVTTFGTKLGEGWLIEATRRVGVLADHLGELYVALGEATPDGAGPGRVALAQACSGGIASACADTRDSTSSLCSAGDTLACAVASRRLPFAESIAGLERVCDQGIVQACLDAGDRMLETTPAGAAGAYGKACRGGLTDGCAKSDVLSYRAHDPGAITALADDCDSGSGFACTALGSILARGEDTSPDPAEAARVWRKGCDLGASDACADLAAAHWNGTVPTKDVSVTVRLADSACSAGSAHGCYVAGAIALTPTSFGGRGDTARAMQYFRTACAKEPAGTACTFLAGPPAAPLAEAAAALDETGRALRFEGDLSAVVRKKDLCADTQGDEFAHAHCLETKEARTAAAREHLKHGFVVARGVHGTLGRFDSRTGTFPIVVDEPTLVEGKIDDPAQPTVTLGRMSVLYSGIPGDFEIAHQQGPTLRSISMERDVAESLASRTTVGTMQVEGGPVEPFRQLSDGVLIARVVGPYAVQIRQDLWYVKQAQPREWEMMKRLGGASEADIYSTAFAVEVRAVAVEFTDPTSGRAVLSWIDPALSLRPGKDGWEIAPAGRVQIEGTARVPGLDHAAELASSSGVATSGEGPVQISSAPTRTAGYRMVDIPGGSTTLGPRYSPATVTHAFLMGRTEVTQALYQLVMGSNPSAGAFKQDLGSQHPVGNVTWTDAVAFCNRLSELEGFTPAYTRQDDGGFAFDSSANGYRLPTEAEWKIAAAGGGGTRFSGSDDINAVARWNQNLADGTVTHSAVATRAPNAFGLYDMTGNVAEWVWDWYLDPPTGGTNPTGPIRQVNRNGRVVLGCGVSDYAKACALDQRKYQDPNGSGRLLGFRVARTPGVAPGQR